MARGPIGRRTAGVHAFFTRELWSRELASLPTFRRWGYGVARVVHLTGLNFVKDRCTWRASALTYITVLSLVPMLALGFSVAKGMGAYETLLNQTIVPFLDSTFGPADAEVPKAVQEALDELAPAEGTDEDDVEAGDAASAEVDDVDDVDAVGAPGALPDDEPEALVAAPDQGASQAAPPSEEGGGDAGSAGPEPADGPEPAPAAPSAEEGGGLEALPDQAAEAVASELAGSEVRRAIDTVLGFVQSTDVSRLGVLGLLIVVWTVIKLLGSVELSFNDIWGVSKARSLPRKIADYLSTIVLVPLLLVTGTGVMSLARSGKLGGWTGAGGESPLFAFFSSIVVVWLGFAFAYILMPNTRVRVMSALVGGIVGGTMWQLFQLAHLKLQVGVANYNAIYSTFAALPIFLFWVQSSWMTVLLGAEAAAAHQNQARHGQLVRSRDYDLALKEVVALRLAVRVAKAFFRGHPAPRLDDLAEDLGCPERTLQEVARGLERGRIVATVDGESDSEDPALILASDPDVVRVQDVLDALKGDLLVELREEAALDASPLDAATDRAFARFREERDRGPSNITLRELVQLADDAESKPAKSAG